MVAEPLMQQSASPADRGQHGMDACKDQPAQPQRINDDIYIAQHLSKHSLANVRELGIRTIVDITQTSSALREQAGSAQLLYCHYPLVDGEWDGSQIDRLLAKIDASPKPCLVFCEMGLRAAAIAIAFKESRKAVLDVLTGTHLGSASLISKEEEAMLDRIENVHPEQAAQCKQLVHAYVQSKIRNAMKRPRHEKLNHNLYIGGQVTEEELHKAKAAGIKSVLNLRCSSEAGQFGLGMLAREESTVRSLGLAYAQMPVPSEGPYSPELRAQVEAKIALMIRDHAPVLVHCRTGQRIVEVLQGTAFEVHRGSRHSIAAKRARTHHAPSHDMQVDAVH